jgi:hypothetical protein
MSDNSSTKVVMTSHAIITMVADQHKWTAEDHIETTKSINYRSYGNNSLTVWFDDEGKLTMVTACAEEYYAERDLDSDPTGLTKFAVDFLKTFARGSDTSTAVQRRSELKLEQVGVLHRLARIAALRGDRGRAYDLVHEALRLEQRLFRIVSDHEIARSIVDGYVAD